MKPLKLWEMALLALAAYLLFGGGSIPGLSTKATAATYVYEKDQTGSVPGPVLVALDKLNRDKAKPILATTFEDDTLDSTGETPEQYKVPLKAATDAGLPALVVTAGASVLKVVKDPKTEDDVLKAVP